MGHPQAPEVPENLPGQRALTGNQDTAGVGSKKWQPALQRGSTHFTAEETKAEVTKLLRAQQGFKPSCVEPPIPGDF